MHVAPEDTGRVIGKQGRIAKAIRVIMRPVRQEQQKIAVRSTKKRTGGQQCSPVVIWRKDAYETVLEIGKIVNVHGLRGDVKVVPWCDDPEFPANLKPYLGREHKPVQVADARLQKGNVLLRLEGVDTVEEAEKLRNQVLYMDRDEVELEEGVYFIQDLIGLEVLDVDTGKSYGKLTDVMQTGANDVYEVRDADGKTVLIPAIPDVVQETDLDGGVMRIRPLEGLFDAD
ncbi:MAG: ribosome maturation factor RimM [Ruminococcus sp.]